MSRIHRFAALRNFGHKYARGCALEGKLQIREFARIRADLRSPSVRICPKKQLAGFTALVLVSRFHAPEAARIVSDCRMADDPAMMPFDDFRVPFRVNARINHRDCNPSFSGRNSMDGA
jgi:hypothetical protein